MVVVTTVARQMLLILGEFIFWWSAVNGQICNPTVDLTIIIDSSADVTSANYYLVTNFVHNFVDGSNIPISFASNRANFIQYDSTFIQSGNYFTSGRRSQTAIQHMTYLGGNSRDTAGVLDFYANNPLSNGRSTNQNVIILLMVGPSNDKASAIQSAQTLHNNGVDILVIGVTSYVDVDEIEQLTSCPGVADQNYFLVDYSELTDMPPILAMGLCNRDTPGPGIMGSTSAMRCITTTPSTTTTATTTPESTTTTTPATTSTATSTTTPAATSTDTTTTTAATTSTATTTPATTSTATTTNTPATASTATTTNTPATISTATTTNTPATTSTATTTNTPATTSTATTTNTPATTSTATTAPAATRTTLITTTLAYRTTVAEAGTDNASPILGLLIGIPLGMLFLVLLLMLCFFCCFRKACAGFCRRLCKKEHNGRNYLKESTSKDRALEEAMITGKSGPPVVVPKTTGPLREAYKSDEPTQTDMNNVPEICQRGHKVTVCEAERSQSKDRSDEDSEPTVNIEEQLRKQQEQKTKFRPSQPKPLMHTSQQNCRQLVQTTNLQGGTVVSYPTNQQKHVLAPLAEPLPMVHQVMQPLQPMPVDGMPPSHHALNLVKPLFNPNTSHFHVEYMHDGIYANTNHHHQHGNRQGHAQNRGGHLQDHARDDGLPRYHDSSDEESERMRREKKRGKRQQESSGRMDSIGDRSHDHRSPDQSQEEGVRTEMNNKTNEKNRNKEKRRREKSEKRGKKRKRHRKKSESKPNQIPVEISQNMDHILESNA